MLGLLLQGAKADVDIWHNVSLGDREVGRKGGHPNLHPQAFLPPGHCGPGVAARAGLAGGPAMDGVFQWNSTGRNSKLIPQQNLEQVKKAGLAVKGKMSTGLAMYQVTFMMLILTKLVSMVIRKTGKRGRQGTEAAIVGGPNHSKDTRGEGDSELT